MKLAAHPPTYLPLISVFYKMVAADVLVLTDDFQYSSHGLMNRTKIKTATGTNWLTVPVLTKGRSGQSILQVRIAPSPNWSKRHWRTLKVNYGYAPFFEKYAEFFETIYSREWTYLLDLNLEFIDYICSQFNLSTQVVLSSDLNLSGKGNSKIIGMLEKLNCDSYFTELEFEQYLRIDEFQAKNLGLEFFSFTCLPYHQLFDGFYPGLSCVDLLFNEGDESLRIIQEED